MPLNRRASISSKISSLSSTTSKLHNKPKIVPHKKVVPSKKIPSTFYDGKSSSSNATVKKQEKPKKTKSVTSIKSQPKNALIDYCKHRDSYSNEEHIITQVSIDNDSEIFDPIIKIEVNKQGQLPKSVKQYYKNENFKPSTESVGMANVIKKASLDTIKEVSESIFHIYDDNETETESKDENKDIINDIKEFRQNNYFECHSAHSRIKNKARATTLKDHKCVYRFYLNDRLFPVPLCTDHTKEIRCIECLLPMNLQIGSKDKINGTIQAKVTLGKKNQDAMILLPIQEPLIIHEKRKENKHEEDSIFFGLINLDKMGHSAFCPNLPGNSLALKYQKGFQEYQDYQQYNYHDIDRDDVIVI